MSSYQSALIIESAYGNYFPAVGHVKRMHNHRVFIVEGVSSSGFIQKDQAVDLVRKQFKGVELIATKNPVVVPNGTAVHQITVLRLS